ncbi:MAG: RloB domain-containing protein [Kiritimatiellae bacterium]|nr:RloB domain-containing protein [Kiritimatiellia bacterium]
MMLQCKKKRELVRDEKTFRDDRLFIVASEDTHAPAQYFDLFRNTRIKVRVLPTEGGLSAPGHVLQRLDDYKAEFDLMEEDELWLMLDTDHWIEPNHVQAFGQVCTEASQKGYQLAHSNPCFEVWILLHVFPLDGPVHFDRCADVITQLKAILGEYSKRTIDARHFPLSSIQDAVAQAETLDSNPNDRWPQMTGSHVYKLVRKLL